jgi:NitT/TauT family transport system substrate-binding protein
MATRATAIGSIAAGIALSALGRAASAQTSPTKVSIGVVGSTSESPLFIADKLGYFREMGIVPDYVTSASAANMIAPLGTGQLDVATGGPSAGLYNAIARGIDIKIVADKGSTPKSYGYMMYPNQQLAVILYGGEFIKKADLGTRFMRAYIRGCRYYNDALRNGKLDGPNAQNVIAIMTEFSSIKDPSIIAAMTPNGNDPNGRLNVASLASDLQFFKDQGLIQGSVTVEQSIDTTFVDTALEALPPYRRRV